jgi:hypothetical protein
VKQLAKSLHGDAACHARVVEGKFRVFSNISQENTRRTDYLRSTREFSLITNSLPSSTMGILHHRKMDLPLTLELAGVPRLADSWVEELRERAER